MSRTPDKVLGWGLGSQVLRIDTRVEDYCIYLEHSPHPQHSNLCPSPMELLCVISSSRNHHTVPQKGPQVPVKDSIFLTKDRRGLR